MLLPDLFERLRAEIASLNHREIELVIELAEVALHRVLEARRITTLSPEIPLRATHNEHVELRFDARLARHTEAIDVYERRGLHPQRELAHGRDLGALQHVAAARVEVHQDI